MGKRGRHPGCTMRKSHPVEHNIWAKMVTRCHGKNPDERYGGRGIKVCIQWRESFDAFLKDMGPRPSPKHSIDRIDVNGDYTRDNCRWATSKEQCQNMRSNVLITFSGLTMVVQDWAAIAMCSSSVLSTMIRKHKPITHHLQNAIDNIKRIRMGVPPHRSSGVQYMYVPKPQFPPQKPHISLEQRLQKYATETTDGKLKINFAAKPIYHTRCSRANWHHPRSHRSNCQGTGN